MSSADTHLLASRPKTRVRQDASERPIPPAVLPLSGHTETLRETVEETIAPCPQARRRAMLLMIASALATLGATYCLYTIVRLIF
ncbi:MAG TPA: hypothetical protein VJ779_00110 [Acetobacteraceae bacterium]|nr:hypothetical protein [Acetobacteraceae bacterium]